MRVDAAILAGGRARRLAGAPKALLEVGGQRIIDRQLAALRPLVDEILFVVGDPTPYAALPTVRLVRDLQPGLGPLAGLQAALAATTADALLVVACDLPFLNPAVLRLLRDSAPDAQLVLPVLDDRPQPLCARYARSALPFIESRLASRSLRLLDLLPDLTVHPLPASTLRPLDPALLTFTNVNTPADLTSAQKQGTGP